MSGSRVLRMLGRRWLLVVAGTALGGIGGLVGYLHAAPQYQATTQLVVGYSGYQSGGEAEARILSAQRATALAQIVTSDPVVTAALQHAGLTGASPEVSASANLTDPFVTISVVDGSPTAAAAVANAFQPILIHELASLVGRLDSSVTLQTIAPATAPTHPLTPVLGHDIGYGLLSGLLVGIGGAIGLDIARRTARDAEDVARLTEVPVIGAIPWQSCDIALPMHVQPQSSRAEAYRQLRTRVLSAEPPPRVLALTSAIPSEGVTTTTLNLATALRRVGRTVVVVDANLRRHKQIRADGLVEVLEGRSTLAAALRDGGTQLPSILPAGTSSGPVGDLLPTAALETTLASLRTTFDYVLVDTPAVLPANDLLAIAPHVDGVLLVARVGRITKAQAQRTVETLARMHVPVVGVVVNGVPS